MESSRYFAYYDECLIIQMIGMDSIGPLISSSAIATCSELSLDFAPAATSIASEVRD